MRALFALFVRSMREDARARLPPILRATLVVVILLILWSHERDFARRSAPGREFLGMVLFANLGLIAIATLGIFSSAITEENEDQTLTLLRMTRLSPLAILFGKGTSRLIGALLLIAAQIPFTLLAVTLGGVSMTQVLSGYAVLGATLFFLCNLALLCSVICRTTIRAGIWTGVIGANCFATLPMVCVATALRNMTMNSGAWSPGTAWEHFSLGVIEANPVYALEMLLFETGSGGNVATHVWINLAAGALCFLLAWLAFDRFCTTAGEEIVRQRRKGGFFRFPIGSRSRPSHRRPVAWKDFRFLIGGFRGLLIRCGLCALILAGAYALERWVDHGGGPNSPQLWRDTGIVTMFLAICLFGIETGLVASRIFGDERRNLTLGTLMTLPRSTGWIVWQKILGCWPVMIPSVILFGLGCWLEGTAHWQSQFIWQRMSDCGWPVVFYIFSQTVLLPVLVAWLSLKLRRGALPAGIAIMAAMNGMVAVVMDTVFRDDSREDFISIAWICNVALAIVLAFEIRRALPRVAAAE